MASCWPCTTAWRCSTGSARAGARSWNCVTSSAWSSRRWPNCSAAAKAPPSANGRRRAPSCTACWPTPRADRVNDSRQALWRQADAIFGQLLELAPEDREAALEAMSMEPALRERVQRMLAAYDGGDGPLDHPEALPLPAALPNALAGRRLGRWLLEHEIGRGGMSVVYAARAVEGPEGRDAAVKVLTLGALADDGRARFLRE